jgi:hypothetical protein
MEGNEDDTGGGNVDPFSLGKGLNNGGNNIVDEVDLGLIGDGGNVTLAVVGEPYGLGLVIVDALAGFRLCTNRGPGSEYLPWFLKASC